MFKSSGKGWSKLDFKLKKNLNWSHWHQGFFYVANHKNFVKFKKGTDMFSNDYLMKRDYQELYTRDIAINALGQIENKKGLDLGGGSGTYSHFLTLMGADMSVQDLSESDMKVGISQCKKIGINVDYKIGDAQSLKFDDSTFDFVISNDFFEHISSKQKVNVIREVARVLKPGGRFVIKTPNLTYLKISINLKRIARIIRFKSPFIYIYSTRNNPDCEHHGLTTYRELEEILDCNFFFNIERVKLFTRRKYIPYFLVKVFSGFWPFTSQIIISSNKSITVPIGDKFSQLGDEKENQI